MRQSLPESLLRAPITPDVLREHRFPPSHLRRRFLVAPTRGVRLHTDNTSRVNILHAYAAALPCDAAFSHETAAELWRLPIPRNLRTDQLSVMRPTGTAHPRRLGVIGRRGLERREVWDLRGLKVVGLADTWCDLGEFAAGRTPRLTTDELVVIADAVVARLDADASAPDWDVLVDGLPTCEFITGPMPAGGPVPRVDSAGLSALHTALSRRTRPRGAVALRRALAAARPGVKSPMETRARLMFARAGFPPAELNGVITDARGQFLLEGDFVWRDQWVIDEYQGDHHGGIRQRSRDEARRALAEDLGWTVIEIYAEDVFAPGRRATCLNRFRKALSAPTRVQLVQLLPRKVASTALSTNRPRPTGW